MMTSFPPHARRGARALGEELRSATLKELLEAPEWDSGVRGAYRERGSTGWWVLLPCDPPRGWLSVEVRAWITGHRSLSPALLSLGVKREVLVAALAEREWVP